MSLSPLFTWRSEVAESDLPATAKHVALTLSLHMSELGDSAFPSLVTQARETSRHKETVVQALRILEERGYLEVERPEKPGKGRVNRYSASLPVRSADPTHASEGSDEVSERVGSSDTKGRLPRTEDVRLGRTTEDDRSKGADAPVANGFKQTAPTETQTYLLRQLPVRSGKGWEAVTFGAVVKLNKRYGSGVVTQALQRATEEAREPMHSAYPLLEAMCKDITA